LQLNEYRLEETITNTARFSLFFIQVCFKERPKNRGTMKAKKVAAGIVVLVLVIVSVLYGVVEYNYHGHLFEWCIPAMRRNAAQYFIDNWRSELGQEDSVWISQSGLNDLKVEDLQISGPVQFVYSKDGELFCNSVYWMISTNGKFIGYVMQDLGPHAINALLGNAEAYHIQFKNADIFNAATQNSQSNTCVCLKIINTSDTRATTDNIDLCIGDQVAYSQSVSGEMQVYQRNQLFQDKDTEWINRINQIAQSANLNSREKLTDVVN
jgi:hypothetical protein